MELFLIRHGQSEADLLKVHEGRADFPLTKEGVMQAQVMALWMAETYPPDRIYASTLKRAAQTAEILGKACGLTPLYDAELMERDNGLLAGLDFTVAKERYSQDDHLPIHRALHNAEPALDFRCRAERVLSKILEESNSIKRVAIVSHGRMINQLFHCLLQLPINCCTGFMTGDTGIHCFRIREDGITLLFSNRTEHMQK